MAETSNGDSDLSEVEVEVNGVTTTLLLSAEDAKQYEDAKKQAASTKKATAANK
jgi:hypothetical protein